MKKYFILSVLVLLMSACNYSTGASNYTSLIAPDSYAAIGKDSYKEISSDLSRSDRNSSLLYGYHVTVTPMTKPYIISDAKNDIYKENISADESNDFIKRQLDYYYADGKQDFMVELASGDRQFSSLKYIHGYIENHLGQRFTINKDTEQSSKLTSLSNFGYGYTVNNLHFTVGLVNIDHLIDFSKPFKMVLEARIHDSPLMFNLSWDGIKSSDR